MRSAFAPTVVVATKTPNPAYPVIVSIQTGFDAAHLQVTVPDNDEMGRPLTSLSKLDIYASEIPFLDKLEAMIGLMPVMEVPLTLDQAGKTLDLDVKGLKPGTNYHWSATVDT